MAYNVLIVDDSMMMRQMVAKTLQIANLPIGQIFKAANGREALQLLKDHWIDIVLADINMPEMNGIEMVQKMLKDGLLGKIPVIIVSTERSVTRIDELRAAGVRAFINKPFTPEAINKVVTEILENRPASH